MYLLIVNIFIVRGVDNLRKGKLPNTHSKRKCSLELKNYYSWREAMYDRDI